MTETPFVVGGNNATEFSATASALNGCHGGTTIGGAVSCSVDTVFTPAAAGTRTATLTFNFVDESPVSVNLVGGDTILYVSNQFGEQILQVDGGTGDFALLHPAGDFLVQNITAPEDLAIGLDNKLYIADPTNAAIYRMNRDGSAPENVYFGVIGGSGGPFPQGLSFSSTGDLYYVEPDNSLPVGVFVVPGAPNQPTIPTPLTATSVVPGTGTPSSCFSLIGPGADTAFDAADNLLFTMVACDGSDRLWSVPPPYTTGNTPTSVLGNTNLNQASAVAFNKATGQMFVADLNGSGDGEILEVVPPVTIGNPSTTAVYLTFSTTLCTKGDANQGTFPDKVTSMAFDGSGNLYVVTSTNPGGLSGNIADSCGKVWKVGPPPCTTTDCLPLTLPAAPILDLQAADVLGSGLNNPQAIGLALQNSGTQAQTQSAGVSATAGSFNLGWPVGCDPTATSGPTVCSYAYDISYPANMFPNGATVSVTPTETSQADWTLRTPPGNGYAGTQIAQVSGYGGDGFIFSAICTTSPNTACPTSPESYDVTSKWKSPDATYCTEGPQLLKADPIGSNNWVGILTSCSPGDPINKGHSGGGLSDFGDVRGVVSNAGNTPTIAITVPANNGTYAQGQAVDAAYTCTPITIVTACIGTQPSATLGTVTVPNGSTIDTSTIGTKTLTASVDVNTGPGAAPVTNTYTVVPGIQASASPGAVNFGNIRVHGFDFEFVELTNTGTVPLSVNGIHVASVTGGDSDDFFALGLCPRTLGGGKSCFILVAFFADEFPPNNPQAANLTINVTGGALAVPLSATVVKH